MVFPMSRGGFQPSRPQAVLSLPLAGMRQPLPVVINTVFGT